MGTIILLLWAIMMLGWYFNSFKSTYGKSAKLKIVEAEKELTKIRNNEDDSIVLFITVAITILFIASFWITMASVFTNTILIIYCVLVIVITLGNFKGLLATIKGVDKLKVSVLSKILLPINTAVIIYFIIFLIERL